MNGSDFLLGMIAGMVIMTPLTIGCVLLTAWNFNACNKREKLK